MKPDCDCRALVLSAIRRGWVIPPQPRAPDKPKPGRRPALKAVPSLRRILHAKQVAQRREKLREHCRPRPGEVQMKDFLKSEAARLGVGIQAVWMRLMKYGKYGSVVIRRPTKRTVFLRFKEQPITA